MNTPSQNQRKILFVEDDLFIRDLVSTKLTQSGFGIEVAQTGKEALEKLQGHYDVIILDLNIPLVSGIDILRRLHQNGQTDMTKVIVFSNNDNPHVRDECMKLGVASFLVKIDTEITTFADKIKAILGEAKPVA